MNFSAFGGPFSGIHQFAKSFGHEQSGAFTTAPGGPQTTDIHGNRYHSNTNHFNQNTAGEFVEEINSVKKKIESNFHFHCFLG